MKRRWHSSFLKIALSVGILAGITSCEKWDTLGEDNNKVVRTPYGLYMGAEDGSIIHTTNGIDFHPVFPPDQYPAKQIHAYNDNLFIIKAQLHKSDNQGRTFNPKYEDMGDYPWSSMIMGSLSHNRLYLASRLGKGIVYSEDNGETWHTDEGFPEDLPSNYKISSYAELANGEVYAYSNRNNILLRKHNVDEDWEPVTAEGFFPVTGTEYYLVSNPTTIFLVDYKGRGGVWYSEDGGAFWTRINQGDLPTQINYHAAVSPNNGSSMVVATDLGAYVNIDGRFKEAFGGLEIGTECKTMTLKENIFKNDRVKGYVYMGTNTGIYRSEDYGRTWDLVSHGPIKKPYVSSF